mmetsp:Transcript_13723/g.57696  ORF Transcript_13723/g.57696 Transcript_13723/m.57696 type:complete len:232 (-) Transcript_13723:123-818(-)
MWLRKSHTLCVPYCGSSGGSGSAGEAPSRIMDANGSTNSIRISHSLPSSSFPVSHSASAGSAGTFPSATFLSNLRTTDATRVELYRMNGADASSKSVIFAMSKLICVRHPTESSAYFIAAVLTSCVTCSKNSGVTSSFFSSNFLRIFSAITVFRSSYRSSASKYRPRRPDILPVVSFTRSYDRWYCRPFISGFIIIIPSDTFCCASSCSEQMMFRIKSLRAAFLNEYTMSR